jgi:Rrf2 family cysteine metabolism transcriptional repressor
MIKLSTKGRYGTRLMLELALRRGSEPVLLRQIAASQDISEKYLWQLISPLKTAGLVRSIRGAKGGYALTKDPAEITLWDINSVLEGPLMQLSCLDDVASCPRSERCVTRDVWSELAAKLKETLDGITLESLVRRHREKLAVADPCSYSI